MTAISHSQTEINEGSMTNNETLTSTNVTEKLRTEDHNGEPHILEIIENKSNQKENPDKLSAQLESVDTHQPKVKLEQEPNNTIKMSEVETWEVVSNEIQSKVGKTPIDRDIPFNRKITQEDKNVDREVNETSMEMPCMYQILKEDDRFKPDEKETETIRFDTDISKDESLSQEENEKDICFEEGKFNDDSFSPEENKEEREEISFEKDKFKNYSFFQEKKRDGRKDISFERDKFDDDSFYQEEKKRDGNEDISFERDNSKEYCFFQEENKGDSREDIIIIKDRYIEDKNIDQCLKHEDLYVSKPPSNIMAPLHQGQKEDNQPRVKPGETSLDIEKLANAEHQQYLKNEENFENKNITSAQYSCTKDSLPEPNSSAKSFENKVEESVR